MRNIQATSNFDTNSIVVTIVLVSSSSSLWALGKPNLIGNEQQVTFPEP